MDKWINGLKKRDLSLPLLIKKIGLNNNVLLIFLTFCFL